MTEPPVVCETSTSGAVTWLRLNRPQCMNSLNTEAIDELNHLLDLSERDSSLRVLVITGTGRAFCTGADLHRIIGADGSIDVDMLLAFVQRVGATFDRIAALSKPVIAAVNGFALAGGFELMAACDIVIANDSARIGEAHSNYGLLPGGGGTRITRIVGPIVAKYLSFTGDFLPARDLVPFGLVNEVVPDDRLHVRVDELAHKIATRSPRGLAHMKRLIDDGLEQPLVTALRLEQQTLAVHAHSADMQEGLTAFREKRQPRYSSHPDDVSRDPKSTSVFLPDGAPRTAESIASSQVTSDRYQK